MIFITVILVLAAIGIFITGNIVKNIKIKLASLIPLVLLVLLIFISGFRIVDSTEIGVVRTLGEIKSTIDAGPHIVNPFFDSVTSYDLKVQTHQAAFASYTKDAQPVDSVVEYQYKIDPAHVMDIAKEYGSQEVLDSKISNLVEEKAKTVYSKYGAMPMLEKRSTLSSEVEMAMDPLEEMFHINFTSVIVRDLDFSDAFEKSVEEKMEAEQKALKAEQVKKEAIIEAEKTREVAKIKAEADIAEAEGEAKAMMIRKEALDAMPDTYIEQMWTEKWDGHLPQIVTGDSNLMITPNLTE